MTKTDQMNFVSDLTRSISSSICAQIKEGKIPESWDGAELRELIALRASQNVTRYFKDKRSRRAKDFWNHVIVENL